MPGPAVGAGDDGGTLRQDEFLRLLGAVLRRWKLIVALAILATGTVAVTLRSMPPVYVASAQILIDYAQTTYTDLADGAGNRQTTVWPSELESYAKVLWSDQLATDVVQTVGVTAFAEPNDTLSSIRPWIGAQLQRFLAFVLPGQADRQPPPARPRNRLDLAVDVFHAQLDISRDPLAAVINVGYRSSDPAMAARVANATAEAFPRELVRAQKVALVATSDYLEARVAALGRELADDDSNAQALRQQLSDFGEGSLARRRYAELVKALSDAQAELVGARDDLAAATDASGKVTDRFANEAIADLRHEEAQLARRMAELGTDLQPRHPAMASLIADHAELVGRLRSAEARVVEGLRRDLAVKETKVAWIDGQLQDAERKMTFDMADQAKLEQLATRTDSTRLLYQDLLTRYQRAREQQLMIRPPARVINAARIPEQPEGRKRFMMIAAAAMGSLGVGAGLALLMELRRRGFQSAEELRAATGLRVLGTLPYVGGFDLELRTGGTAGLQRRVFADSMRRTALRLLPQDASMGEVLLVTSALPNEGKTVISLSLGRQLAQGGARVLVIDADFRRRSLQAHLQHLPVPDTDLVHYLRTPLASVDDAIVKDERFGVDFLPSSSPVDDPMGLMSSLRMARLLRQMAGRYQVILVDTPPVLAVADAMALMPSVDKVVFVARWRSTSRETVRVAVDEIRQHGGHVAGLILNAVDLNSYPRHARGDQLAYYRQSAGYLRTMT